MAYRKLDIGEPKSVRELSQYISQEFDRVAMFLRAAQGAATILQNVAGAIKQVGAVPVLLDEWTQTTPFFEYFAVRASLPDDGVWIRRPGMYEVNFTIQGAVQINRDYTITVTNNGVPTLLASVSDPSNQTDVVTMVATGTQRLRATGVGGPGVDDLLQLFITSTDEGSDWTTLNAFFTAVYVAE